MPFVLLLALADVWASAHSPEAASDHVYYVIADSTVMRAEPYSGARSLGKLKKFDIVSGREAVQGWLHIDGAASGATGELGWVPFVRENVVRGSLESLRLRLFRLQQTKWSEQVKLDVIRGRIRRGFTAEQVRLALGDPVKKDLRETAGDVAEEWQYEDCTVLFSHTGVRTIIDIATDR